VAAPLPIITVPFALRRFFGSIAGGSEVNELRGVFREIASWAAVSRSNSAETESLTGLLLTAPPFKTLEIKDEHPAVKIPAIIPGRDGDDAKAYLERHIAEKINESKS